MKLKAYSTVESTSRRTCHLEDGARTLRERGGKAGAWLALVSLALLATSPVSASDSDVRPAYLIYIDPDSGKYTTSDPSLAPDSKPASAEFEPAPIRSPERSKLPLLLGSALLVLVIGWGVRLLSPKLGWAKQKRAGGR